MWRDGRCTDFNKDFVVRRGKIDETTSAAEAEYVVFPSACFEFLWTSQILKFELEPIDQSKNHIMIDKQAVVKMSENDVSGYRAKLIDIKYHIIWELLSEKTFLLEYCATTDSTAYILTRLQPKSFYKLFSMQVGLNSCLSGRLPWDWECWKLKFLELFISLQEK